MPNDNLKFLYQTVKDNGLYTKSYDEFIAKYWGETSPQVEQKKNTTSPQTPSVANQTGSEIQTTTTPNPKQNTVSNLFNQYSTIINIASSTNKDISDKPVSKIGKMFTTPNEFRSKYMPKSKQKEFEQTNPNAIQISTSQPIKKQANKWDSNEKVDDSDKLRLDGTDKGKGFYGEITVQSGKDKGKKMTELSVGYEVDGKEILTPLLNPYTSLDDIENVRAGGQPSEQMHRDAKRWLFYCLKNNRSPFATEEETINLYTDEDNKIKFQTATDFQRYVANTMTEDDKKVLVGEANTYPIGSVQYKDYANKEASRDMLNEQMEQFAKDTGFEPQAYLAYQDYLIKGGTSFEDWKKEYNPQSKIGMDEALALTVATLPTLIYDVVYRDGDMIKRIAKGTNEFATGVRTSSIMGDLSYITQGLFTLTKEGKYNPFKAAGELKQTDVKWFNRFDLNAKDEVALFMGSIGVDYLPFEVAGKVSSKMLQTLVKPGALNYYDFLIKTNAVPETALTATEKIFQGSFQMGTTLGLYSGAQSTLNQLMYSTPKQFISDGWQTVLNDVTHSTLTGYIAGGIGGATGVLTNQVKNKIISDAMKNGIMDATKLQKFAYVGTGVAGVTLSTILEASTFVAMSGEELNTKNILKESIKFATLKFQNPAGLKIDKLRNKMTVDPNFKPETAWEGRFEPKLNEAELAMLGCKNVSEAKELVKRDGLEAVTADIPTATAFKLLYAETGIVTPTKAVDFAPDKVTITTENINGKEYSVVNTYNKQGELTHISPHENYKDAATEVEFITNKMQEYKVYKAADRIKPEWYAEFNQTANVDKIALNDALQAKDPTPEQLATIKEFNKQVDDFIAKKEKEVTVEKPKKKEKAETETVASEVKEEVMTLNDKEYTVRENEVFVKNEQGLLTRETDNDIIKQVKEKQNDTQDKAGLPSEVQQGEKPIETKSVESTGEKDVSTEGVTETTVKEVAEIPLTETTYNFESVKQENIDRYDYYTKEVDGVTKYFKKEKSAETPVEAGKKEVITDTTNELIINNLNPTGGLLVDYNPKARMTAKLADNITTLDKTMGGSPDDIITIYRGATKKQKKIVPGDYITTNKELAKSYTGDGTVLEMEARKGDILDDINEPLGEEYIYRPKEYEKSRKEKQEDTQDKAGLPSEVQQGEKPIETKSVESTGEKEIATGGDVQTPKEKEVAQSDKTQAITIPQEKMEIQSEQVIFNLKEVGKIKEAERIKAIRETAKSVNEFNTEITNFLKSVKNEGTLSPARYNTLIRKIGRTIKETKRKDGTIITSEMKKSEVIDYVVKSIIKAVNSQTQSSAVKSQKKAIKLIDSKQQNFGSKSLEALNLVSNIDISQLTPEQAMKFNEIVNEMTSNKNRQTPETIDKFMSDLQNIQWTPKERKAATKEDVAALIKDIFTTPANTLADYKAAKGQLRKLNNLIEKIYSDKVNKLEGTQEQIDKGIEKARRERDEMLDYLESKNNEIDLVFFVKNNGEFVKQKYLDSIKVTGNEFISKLNRKEDTGLTDKTNKEVEFVFHSLKEPKVIERLSPENAELIDYAMDNLNNGFYNGQTAKAIRKVYDIVNTVEITNAFNKVKNNKSFKKLQDKSANEVLIDMQTSNDYRIDLDVFGNMGHEMQNSIFQKNHENIAESKRFVGETWKEVGDAFDKLKKSIKKNNRLSTRTSENYKEAVTKLAILKTELAWQNNIQRDPMTGKRYEPTDKAKPDYMKTHSDAALYNKDLSSVKDIKDFDRFEKVWNDIKSDKNNFNPDGTLNLKKIYNELSPAEKNVWDSVSKLHETTNQYVELASIKHGRTYSKINNYDYFHKINEVTKKDKDAESLLDSLLNSYESPTKQAGSTHERDMIPRIIRTDMDNMIKKQLGEIAHDIYVRDNLLSTMRALDASAKDVKGFVRISDALKKTVGERSIRAENKEQITNTTKTFESIYGYMSKKYLGLPTRIIKELPTNFERAIVAEWSKDIVKNVESEYVKMLDDIIGESKNYSQFAEDISTGKSLGSKLIEDIIIFSDRKIAPAIFKSAFNKSFERITGKEFNIKEYQTNPKYRQEYYKAINESRADGFIRLQELFNSKSSFGSATHVKIMNQSINKRSGTGKSLYFLQSFAHNEFNQMVRSTKKLINKDTRAEGIRDILALTTSNYMYMQIGMAMLEFSKSYWSQVAEDGDLNPITAFEDGMYNFWKNNYSNPEVIIASTVKSLSALAIGKYGIVANLLGSIFLGFVDRDKRLNKETKEAIFAQTRGLGMSPMDFSSGGYSSASSFAKAIHPLAVEIVDAADVIENIADLTNITDEKEEDSALEYLMLFNSTIRYAHINPASNMIDKWMKNYEKARNKSEKTKKEDSAFGTSGGYKNESKPFGN
jgi:hypothetical protein